MKIALFIEQGCVHNEVLLAQYEAAAYAAMKKEAKRAQAAPSFPHSSWPKAASFFMRRQARFIEKSDLLKQVAFFMAPPVGLEPTTCGLTVRRSTD